MTPESALELVNGALWLAAITAGPVLALSLGAGVLAAIFQTTTQINEQTLTFLPKVIALVAGLVAFGPWLLTQVVEYATLHLGRLPEMVR